MTEATIPHFTTDIQPIMQSSIADFKSDLQTIIDTIQQLLPRQYEL